MKAQLYSDGTDPGRLKWNSISTNTYKVIYPRGLDSLAREYAVKLERYAPAVTNGIGMSPNQNYRKQLPVVLHSYTTEANGMVVWTPRRMELMTIPSAYAPESTPWQKHLILHESRHASQMQLVAGKPFRWLKYLTGQIAAGGIGSAIYGSNVFLEGDAVVTETALTDAGRGRTADFMEFYRVSFAEDQYRNFWRWRYGSYDKYTPDYYRAGYLAVGGARAYYDKPDFTVRYYDRIRENNGIAIGNLGSAMKEISGHRTKKTFDILAHNLQEEWAADDSLRAPFMPSRRLMGDPRYYSDISSLEISGDRIFALRSGIGRAPQIIELDMDGNILHTSVFSALHSGLMHSSEDGFIYWSEYANDPRWEQASTSIIRCSYGTDRKRTVAKGHNYYNPVPMGSGLLAVTEYTPDGRSAAVVLKTVDGSVYESFTAPGGMQVVETACIDGKLYASAITDDGFGIYLVRGWKKILDAGNTKVKQLWSHDGMIMFTCDLTGVNELYSLDPASGKTMQMTNTRFGAASFRFSEDGKTLYYTSLDTRGRHLCCTDTDDLPSKPADWNRIHVWPIADRLAEGEIPLSSFEENEVEVSEPEKYVKAAHLFGVHSWAPVYVDYDAVASMTFEDILVSAGIGATALFQNSLGTSSGLFGYHYDHKTGRHSGHGTITYRGLYPVIEASVDFNDRSASGYHIEKQDNGGYALKASAKGQPLLSSSLNVYVPLNWTRGGWTTGVLPRVRMSFTNDTFNSDPLSRIVATVSAYAVQRTPASSIYPKLGAGAQIGYSARPWSSPLMCSNMFTNVYAYLPGAWDTHGIRVSGLFVNRFDDGSFCEAVVNAAPRGYRSDISTALAAYKTQSKFSIDYALPFLPLEWSFLSSIAYVKNLELTLHGDLTRLYSKTGNGNLYSAGADLCLRLGSLFWLPFDTRIGVSYNYNGGNISEKFSTYSTDRHSFDLILTVDL